MDELNIYIGSNLSENETGVIKALLSAYVPGFKAHVDYDANYYKGVDEYLKLNPCDTLTKGGPYDNLKDLASAIINDFNEGINNRRETFDAEKAKRQPTAYMASNFEISY